MSTLRALIITCKNRQDDVDIRIRTYDPVNGYRDIGDETPSLIIDTSRGIWSDAQSGDVRFEDIGTIRRIGLMTGGVVSVFDPDNDTHVENAVAGLATLLESLLSTHHLPKVEPLKRMDPLDDFEQPGPPDEDDDLPF